MYLTPATPYRVHQCLVLSHHVLQLSFRNGRRESSTCQTSLRFLLVGERQSDEFKLRESSAKEGKANRYTGRWIDGQRSCRLDGHVVGVETERDYGGREMSERLYQETHVNTCDNGIASNSWKICDLVRSRNSSYHNKPYLQERL